MRETSITVDTTRSIKRALRLHSINTGQTIRSIIESFIKSLPEWEASHD